MQKISVIVFTLIGIFLMGLSVSQSSANLAFASSFPFMVSLVLGNWDKLETYIRDILEEKN